MKSIVRDIGLTNSAIVRVPKDSAIVLNKSDGNILNKDGASLYRRNIGRLIYISAHTRAGVEVVTSMLAKHVANLEEAVIRTAEVYPSVFFYLQHLLELLNLRDSSIISFFTANKRLYVLLRQSALYFFI